MGEWDVKEQDPWTVKKADPWAVKGATTLSGEPSTVHLPDEDSYPEGDQPPLDAKTIPGPGQQFADIATGMPKLGWAAVKGTGSFAASALSFPVQAVVAPLDALAQALMGSQTPLDDANKAVSEFFGKLTPEDPLSKAFTEILALPFSSADAVLTEALDATKAPDEVKQGLKMALYAALLGLGKKKGGKLVKATDLKPDKVGKSDPGATPSPEELARLNKVADPWDPKPEPGRSDFEFPAADTPEAIAAAKAKNAVPRETSSEAKGNARPVGDEFDPVARLKELDEAAYGKESPVMEPDGKGGVRIKREGGKNVIKREPGRVLTSDELKERNALRRQLEPAKEYPNRASTVTEAIPEPKSKAEQSLPSRFATTVHKKWQAFRDKTTLQLTPRTARASERGANAISEFANASNAAPDITEHIIGEVMQENGARCPDYIIKKAMEGQPLSPKEQALYKPEQVRREFGRMRVYDGILGIFHRAKDRAGAAAQQVQDMKARLAQLQDEYRREMGGKPSATSAEARPRLEKSIQELQDAIAKARAEMERNLKKAENIDKAHDVNQMTQFVTAKAKKFSGEIARYKALYNKYMDDMFHEVKGSEGELDMDNTGHHTEMRVNLTPVGEGAPEWKTGEVIKSRLEPTGKSSGKDPNVRDVGDIEAMGTGNYTTSLYGSMGAKIAERSFKAKRVRMLKTLEEEGLVAFEDHNDSKGKKPYLNPDHEWTRYSESVELPSTDPETGRTTMKPHTMHMRADVAPEIKQAFYKAGARSNWINAIDAYQLFSPVDALSHFYNMETRSRRYATGGHAILNKIPIIARLDGGVRVAKYLTQASEKPQEYLARKRRMSEEGLLRSRHDQNALLKAIADKTGNPDILRHSISSEIYKIDTAIRMLLEDYWQHQVDAGKAEPGLVNKRNFISRMGNYNPRMMEHWAADVRSKGATFLVASRAFVRNAFEGLTGAPGFKTTGLKAEATLRMEQLAAPMIAVTAAYMWNQAMWGDGKPEGAPWGSVKLSDKMNLNLAPGEWARGMRYGTGDIIEGMAHDQTAAQIAGKATRSVIGAFTRPFAGPAVEATHIALTGDDTTGRKVAKGSAPTDNVLAALKHSNALVAAGTGGQGVKDFFDPFLRVGGVERSRQVPTGAEQIIKKAGARSYDPPENQTKAQWEWEEKIRKELTKEGYESEEGDEKDVMLQMSKSEGGRKLLEAVEKKHISDDRARTIFRERGIEDPYQRKFTHIPLLDAVEAYSIMDARQRQEYAPLIEKKIETMWKKLDARHKKAEESGIDSQAQFYEEQKNRLDELVRDHVNGLMRYEKNKDAGRTYFVEEDEQN